VIERTSQEALLKKVLCVAHINKLPPVWEPPSYLWIKKASVLEPLALKKALRAGITLYKYLVCAAQQ